jgi:RNA polymerase sigma-70 factor (ECF subfamily)
MSRHDMVLVDRHHPEQIVLGRLPQIELERALRDLPEDFRLAILLRDVENLSYREIASLLGIPLGTVRSRINRARLRLRGALLTSGVDC